MERPFQAYQGDEPYVFVCYAHEDRDAVYPEITWLHDHGVNIWYDEGISPGSEWPEALAQAIKGCHLFLYYVSPCAGASEHCRRELTFALDQSRVTLAVHLEETDIPDGLSLSLGNRQAILRYELASEVYRAKLVSAVEQATMAGVWDGIRKRETQHEILRRTIASGQPIDVLMDKLLQGSKRIDGELKLSGVIVLFAAPGLALLGWFISLQTAGWLLPILGASAIVGCTGIGLLTASKAVARSYQDDSETLRRMIETDEPIDQAVMDKLLGNGERPDRELQVWGLITLSVAPGLALLGWLISLQATGWLLPILGAAALVGCAGIGLLAASNVIQR